MVISRYNNVAKGLNMQDRGRKIITCRIYLATITRRIHLIPKLSHLEWHSNCKGLRNKYTCSLIISKCNFISISTLVLKQSQINVKFPSKFIKNGKISKSFDKWNKLKIHVHIQSHNVRYYIAHHNSDCSLQSFQDIKHISPPSQH